MRPRYRPRTSPRARPTTRRSASRAANSEWRIANGGIDYSPLAIRLVFESMSIEHQEDTKAGLTVWLERIVRARLVLGASAVVFFALVLMGVLTYPQAVIGFLIVAAPPPPAFTRAHAGGTPAPPHRGNALPAAS